MVESLVRHLVYKFGGKDLVLLYGRHDLWLQFPWSPEDDPLKK